MLLFTSYLEPKMHKLTLPYPWPLGIYCFSSTQVRPQIVPTSMPSFRFQLAAVRVQGLQDCDYMKYRCWTSTSLCYISTENIEMNRVMSMFRFKLWILLKLLCNVVIFNVLKSKTQNIRVAYTTKCLAGLNIFHILDCLVTSRSANSKFMLIYENAPTHMVCFSHFTFSLMGQSFYYDTQLLFLFSLVV